MNALTKPSMLQRIDDTPSIFAQPAEIARAVALVKSSLGASRFIDPRAAISPALREAIIARGKALRDALTPASPANFHKHIGKMLAYMPRTSTGDAAETIEVYASYLSGPEWAVAEVAELFIGGAMRDDKWAPTPGEFSNACARHVAPLWAELLDLRKVLSAKVANPVGDAEREHIRALLAATQAALSSSGAERHDYPRLTPQMRLEQTSLRNQAEPMKLSEAARATFARAR